VPYHSPLKIVKKKNHEWCHVWGLLAFPFFQQLPLGRLPARADSCIYSLLLNPVSQILPITLFEPTTHLSMDFLVHFPALIKWWNRLWRHLTVHRKQIDSLRWERRTCLLHIQLLTSIADLIEDLLSYFSASIFPITPATFWLWMTVSTSKSSPLPEDEHAVPSCCLFAYRQLKDYTLFPQTPWFLGPPHVNWTPHIYPYSFLWSFRNNPTFPLKYTQKF